ncbi:MAG: TIGR00730 family Rossman fold protein [Elusimicrobia bacterium]|nr:TIGR00730 family Rossman fold protein [Elusimicrobiota bacterium]
MKRICVFCGSSSGENKRYRAMAVELGRALAARGLGLVFGGGRVGLMGAIADAVLAAGGEAIGVIPEDLKKKELAHTGLSDLRVVGSMHERKALMERLSDGFIAMPGGFGTLDEFCEILTWAQLGLHRKPCGMLNVDGYFDSFLRFVDHSVSQGFIRKEHRGLLIDGADPAKLLDLLGRRRPPPVKKWLHRP